MPPVKKGRVEKKKVERPFHRSRGNLRRPKFIEAPKKKHVTKALVKVESEKEKIFRAPTSGVSHSNATLKHKGVKLAKALKILMPTVRYRDFFTSNLNTLVSGTGYESGVQCAGIIFSTFQGPDISNLVNIGLKNYSATTQQGPQIGAESNTQQSFKIFLSHVNCISSYTNAGSDCVILDIYDCIAKKDFSSGTYYDPLTDWNQGVIDTSLGGTTAVPSSGSGLQAAYNIPFTTPSESKLFNMKWKIVQKTKVELGLGRAHDHVFEYTPNKILDTELFSANSSSSTGNFENTKLLTHYQFAVARSVFLDNTSSTTATGTVSLGPVKVLIGGTRMYSFKLLGQQPTNMQYNGSMYSVAIGGSQLVYNEGSGAQTTISYQ